jgi:hypothetical protein
MGLTEGWVTGDPAVSERRALPARVWAACLIAIEQLSYPPAIVKKESRQTGAEEQHGEPPGDIE